MHNLLDLSLIQGPIPVVVAVLGVLALISLAVRKNRTWWTRVLPSVVLACVVLVAGLKFVVDQLWKPFPEPLPVILAVWAAAAVVALCLAVARLRSGRWYGSVARVLLVLVVVTSALSAVNSYFGVYPTTRTALDAFSNNRVNLDDVAKPATEVLEVPEGEKLADVWHRPADLRAEGTVSEVRVPGAFAARQAWVYLPPAYAATPRPRLPVVVLLAGQPGAPRDWFDAGGLAGNMDRFAREHDGLAPIVVVADQLGARLANPLCLDSKLGQSETYLARDVPGWIKQRLTVDERREAWTIAGFSQGGTCALQLAVRAPDVYGGFVDVTGQREPTLGTRADTVKAAFGGDEAAFVRVNPMDVLARERFPRTAGVIVAGKNDTIYHQAAVEVFEACRKAGMDVQWKELPGAHDWNVWRPGFYDSLPWLAARAGLSK